MKITSKGQVTIPQELREKYLFLPNSEAAFCEENGWVYLKKIATVENRENVFDKVKGTATSGLSTEEIMKLTRRDS